MNERNKGLRLFPAWWVVGTWIVFAGAIIGLRSSNAIGDNAVMNVLTAAVTTLAFMILGVWFAFCSGYSRRTRLGTVTLGITVVAVLAVAYEVEQVNGEMIPKFRYRFSPKPDELLEIPTGELSDTANLSETTEFDFPQFLGPSRTGRYDAVQLDIAWKANPPKLVWRQPIGAGWSAFAAVNGYAVTMEQRGDEELVTCYEVETGDLIWSHSNSDRHSTILGGVGPRSTPSIDEGKVYALGATGKVFCLNGANGNEIWRDDLLERYGVAPGRDLRGVAWGRSGAPLVVDNLVVVPAGGPAGGAHRSLVAYDKDSGSVVWESGDRQVSYSSPTLGTVAGVRQIISVNQDTVSGHDPENGDVLWEHPWPGDSAAEANAAQPVVLPGDRVLVSKAYGGGAMMLRLSKADNDMFAAEEVWHEKRTLRTKFTSVVVAGDYLFGLSDGILECVAAEDGARRWKRGRYKHGQVLGIGDVLLVQAEEGDVVLVAATPDRGRELARLAALSGKTWNNPCMYGRFLLVRNAEEACCYELPLVDG